MSLLALSAVFQEQGVDSGNLGVTVGVFAIKTWVLDDVDSKSGPV